MFSKFKLFFQSRIDFTSPEYCKKYVYVVCPLKFFIHVCKCFTIFFNDVIDVYYSIFNAYFIVYRSVSYFNIFIEKYWVCLKFFDFCWFLFC